MPREQRTARLTILVDPDKKAVFERLCALAELDPLVALRPRRHPPCVRWRVLRGRSGRSRAAGW